MPKTTTTKRAPRMSSKQKAFDLRQIVKASDFKNFEKLAETISCSPVTLYAAAKAGRHVRNRTIRIAVNRALGLADTTGAAL